eukprot:4343694-Lingulodinium_polyedra.AAC.1
MDKGMPDIEPAAAVRQGLTSTGGMNSCKPATRCKRCVTKSANFLPMAPKGRSLQAIASVSAFPVLARRRSKLKT